MKELAYPSCEQYKKKPPHSDSFLKTLWRIFSVIVVIAAFILGGFRVYKKFYKNPHKANTIYSVLVDRPVRIFRSGEASWEEARNFQLRKNDILVTGTSARNVLGFRYQASIRVAPMSKIKLISYNDKTDTLTIGIEEGKLWLESWSGKYKIISNHGTVTMQDAAIRVIAGGEPPLRLFCYSGSALVETTAFQNNRIYVQARQKIYVTSNNEISSPSPFIPNRNDQWEKWNVSFSGKKLTASEVPAGYTFEIWQKKGNYVYAEPPDQENYGRVPQNNQYRPSQQPQSSLYHGQLGQDFPDNQNQQQYNPPGDDFRWNYRQGQPQRRAFIDNKQLGPADWGPVPSIGSPDQIRKAPLNTQSNRYKDDKYVPPWKRSDDDDDDEESEPAKKEKVEIEQDALKILHNETRRSKTDGREAPPGYKINDEPKSPDGGTGFY